MSLNYIIVIIEEKGYCLEEKEGEYSLLSEPNKNFKDYDSEFWSWWNGKTNNKERNKQNILIFSEGTVKLKSRVKLNKEKLWEKSFSLNGIEKLFSLAEIDIEILDYNDENNVLHLKYQDKEIKLLSKEKLKTNSLGKEAHTEIKKKDIKKEKNKSKMNLATEGTIAGDYQRETERLKKLL